MLEVKDLKARYKNIKYWGRHAPILFPIIGKVKENKYRVGQDEFELGQHGFARDCEFELVESSAGTVLYRLTSDENSLKKYPYKFELYIEYKLEVNKLNISYKVKNIDKQKIYFSIGAHPGFNCPLLEGEKFEDYYFEFNKSEVAKREFLDEETLLLTGKSEIVLDNTNILKLSRELFTLDALIFKDLKSNQITLKSDKNNKSISMDFGQFPCLGIWSKNNNAPFVCIEPWFGHADLADFNEDFSEKTGVIALDIEKEFNCSYSISVEQG